MPTCSVPVDYCSHHAVKRRKRSEFATTRPSADPAFFCHTITHLATPCLSEDRAWFALPEPKEGNPKDEIPLHEPVVQRTITRRQQYRIRLPDALIAATAFYLGFPLVTRNTRDFQTINGLVILNPFE